MPERQTSSGFSPPVPLPGGHAVLFHASTTARGTVWSCSISTPGEEKTVVEGGSNRHLFRHGPSRLRPRRHADGRAVQSLGARRDGRARCARAGYSHPAVQAARPTTRSRPTARSPTCRGAPTAASTSAVVWVDRAGKVIGRAVPDPRREPARPEALSPDGKRLLLVTRPRTTETSGATICAAGRRSRSRCRTTTASRSGARTASRSRSSFARHRTSTAVARRRQRAHAASRCARSPFAAPRRSGRPPGSVDDHVHRLRRATSSRCPLPAATRRGPQRRRLGLFEFDPALSPNGRWLAYVSNRTGQARDLGAGVSRGRPGSRVEQRRLRAAAGRPMGASSSTARAPR